MDAIDIQQIHNNNFTNTQYGKFQRISYNSWTVEGRLSRAPQVLPTSVPRPLQPIHLNQGLIFIFSWWKHNRYQY